MHDHETVRKKLWDDYLGLSFLEQSLVHLCAVIHEPATAPVVYSCFRKTRLTTLYPDISSLKSIKPVLQNLQRLELLTDRLQCHRDFTEIAIRQAVECRDSTYFQDLVDTVLEVMPFSDCCRYPTGSELQRHRLMRDFRIAIYTLNFPSLRECHRQLVSQDAAFVDPFVGVFQNPFDCNWLGRLPIDLQITALSAIFTHTLAYLDSDADALAYGVRADFLERMPEHDRVEFYSHLIPRLLLGGQIATARKLLSNTDHSPLLSGFSGWISLLEGKVQTAVDLFESDLAALRNWTRNKTEYFKGMVGVFYILALMKQSDSTLFDKMETVLNLARSNRFHKKELNAVFTLISAAGHILKFDTESARLVLLEIRTDHNPLIGYFSALVEYGIARALNPDDLDRVTLLFIRAKNAGLHWLALECAELLNAAGSPDEKRMEYVHGIQAETGIQSIFAIIKPEAPWKSRLHALTYSLGTPSKNSAKPGALRLAWVIRLTDQHLELIPREQKRLASGTWSPGKILPLRQLFSNPQLDHMTRQDQVICSSIRKVKFNARVFQYFFDWDKALPALIGHPLVFLADQPTFPIEIVQGEPKFMVESRKSAYIMTFSPKMIDNRIAVTLETPRRLSIVCLNTRQQRIARIIGNHGLVVPVSAREEVLTAIAALSSLITVHSGICGAAASMIEIKSDPIPHIHLTACLSGFRAEIFVQPFVLGQIWLKPGEGAERIVTDIDGQSCQIHRNLAQELKNAIHIESCCMALSRFPHPNWQWMIKDPYAFLDILLELNLLQKQGRVIVQWPEGEKLRIIRETSASDLRVSIKGKSGLFEISGQLVVDDGLVVELEDLIAGIPQIRKRFMPLGEGRFLALTEDLKNQLLAITAVCEQKSRSLLFHPAAALTMEGITKNLTYLDIDEKWRSQIDRIQESITHAPKIPADLNATLRGYQIEGYTWLSRLSFWGVGACLADDMGLGKTVQVLAVILERASNGPSLVVAPASVCLNWLDEIRCFAPSLNIVQLADQHREAALQKIKPLDVLVVSYGLLLNESELLSSRTWETIVLDEAQVIKNMKAKRFQAAMNLTGRFRIITTGTPIENHLGELFTLFRFINPGLLGSARHFFNTFTDPIEKRRDSEAGERLKKIIQPFILRRMKSQVLEELPPLTEIILKVDLYPGEAAFYESIRIKALKEIESGRTGTGRNYQFRVFGEIAKLRQACCHTRLVLPASSIPSAKLDLFESLLSDLIENGHNVLVFSQFVGYLTLIRELLEKKRIRYRYLDGRTATRTRKREIDAFQAGDGKIFLISLKAGGLGLNLTSADYVIHMDPWWNPAVEAQASDRAHRIGQKRPVTVYRLVARNTIEEKIIALHQHKRNLAGTLLEGGDISGRISAGELLEMIQAGQHPNKTEFDVRAAFT